MYIDSLVSVNVYHDKELRTLNKVPLLYYWNGNGNLLECILYDNSFKEKYLDKISLETFKHLQLAYFYFKYDENDNEQYIENIINISEYLDLSKFESINMIYELIIKYMFKLYNIALKEDYEDVKIYNEEIIIDIYNRIKNKYEDKFNKNTFLNWIRKELINKEDLTNNNTNYIINLLNKILETLK